MRQDSKKDNAGPEPESDATVVGKTGKSPPSAGDADLTEVIPARTDNRHTGALGRTERAIMRFDGSSSGPSAVGPGSVLDDRYDLLEQIGTGGMGSVYKALDRRDIEAGNSRFIAVKVLNDEFRANPELLRALHSEARKTQALAHPNILTVYDFDRDGRTVFMTMEYLEGVTLDKIIKNNRAGLQQQDALPLLKQICGALSHAHGNGIIHSDFKPSNVFVDTGNRVKVLDFGIARLQNFSRVGSFDAGVLGGVTPAYATLEMLQGGTPDPRDDLYALACVAYQLFAGVHPFNGARIDECIKKDLEPKRIPALNSNQWRVLKKALAFKREDRIDSVESFWEGLGALDRPKASYYAVPSVLLLGIALAVAKYGELSFFATTGTDVVAVEEPINRDREEVGQHTGEAVTETAVTPIDSLPESVLSVSLNKTEFKIGDSLVVEFRVEQPLYIYIAVIDAAGSVAWVFPNPYQQDNYCLPGTVYRIPPESGDFTIDVGEPKGTDKLIAIAATQALSIDEIDPDSLDELKNTYRIASKTTTFTID